MGDLIMLSQINGIGDKRESDLHDLGVSTLQELIESDHEDIKEEWKEEAKLILASEPEEQTSQTYRNLSNKIVTIHSQRVQAKSEITLDLNASSTFEKTPHFKFLVKSGHIEKV